jgi:hypothetical protein
MWIDRLAHDSKEERNVSMVSTDSGHVSKSTPRIDASGLAVDLSDNRQVEQNAHHQDRDDG